MYLFKIFCAFLIAIFAACLSALLLQQFGEPNPEWEFNILVSFIGLCFGLYTLRIFSYELAYTIRTAINNADKGAR